MHLSLIKGLMDIWEEIVKDPSPICPINHIPVLRKKEMQNYCQMIMRKYGDLPWIRSDQESTAEYSSCIFEYEKYWMVIPYHFYVDKTVGTVFYKLKKALLSLTDDYSLDFEEFFRVWWRISANHFGKFNKTDIEILKAMIALYDQKTHYENPSTEEITKYLRKSIKYVSKRKEQLVQWSYSYRALINYGTLGFTTLAIWNLPADIEKKLLDYRLMWYNNRNYHVTVLTLPYELNALLQENLFERDFQDEFIIPLANQGWNWNLTQLEPFEKDSWKEPIRVDRTIERMILSREIPVNFQIEKPYLLQDIRSQPFGESSISKRPKDMRVLMRILKDFPTFTWMAHETGTTNEEFASVYERLKRAGIINVRIDYRHIGIGTTFGIFYTASDPIKEKKGQLIDQILALIMKYPFSWTLTSNQMIVACVVIPIKWAKDFYFEWNGVAQSCKILPSKIQPSLTIGLSHPSLFRHCFQLPWEELWYEKGGELFWKNPLE